MPKVHSKATFLSLAGTDISLHCKESELEREADEHDLTTYGKDDHVYEGGLLGGMATIGGWYDSTAATGPRAVIEPLLGTVVQLIRRVEGTGAGKPQDTVNVLVRKYVETSPVADFVTWSADLRLSDAVVSTTQ